jgi:hypothetical protein
MQSGVPHGCCGSCNVPIVLLYVLSVSLPASPLEVNRLPQTKWIGPQSKCQPTRPRCNSYAFLRNLVEAKCCIIVVVKCVLLNLMAMAVPSFKDPCSLHTHAPTRIIPYLRVGGTAFTHSPQPIIPMMTGCCICSHCQCTTSVLDKRRIFFN